MFWRRPVRVIPNYGESLADQVLRWQATTMTDWLLSLPDVAESLGCTHDDVATLIARGDLGVAPGTTRRVAHSELRRFVAHMQSSALTLGVYPLSVPSLIASQPIGVGDEDHTTR